MIEPNPIGYPSTGFATMTINLEDKKLEEVSDLVNRAIDSAASSAKERGVKLTNVQISNVYTSVDTGLILVFTISRN